ncbi:MAG: PadR family transcriptional regulator [Candidatus Deferrimicrobiota bacterium]
MARRNTSRYAVLGLLTWHPMSGYEIRKTYKDSVANFWSESFGQIYPILRQLVEEGLSTRTVERREGRPDRHTYTVTDKGREELLRWLAEPAEPRKERSEFMLKLFFGSQIPVAESIRHVRRAQKEREDLLARLSAIKARLLSEHAGKVQLPYWLLTVTGGMAFCKAYIEWCDEAIAVFGKINKKKTGRGTKKGERK